jgi:hypothetical protein
MGTATRISSEPAVVAALDRIAEMAKLPANWDREDADPPTALAVAGACSSIEAVAEAQARRGRGCVAPATSSPIPDGGLQVEWEGPNARIDVQVSPDGTYGDPVMWGSDGDAGYEEADEAAPDEVLALIDRVLAF